MTAVIFDLDGVLVDSERHWQRAFADVTNEVASDSAWPIAPRTPEDMVKYQGGRVNETLRDIFTGLGHPEVAEDDDLITRLTRRAVTQASQEFLRDPAEITSSVEVARALAAKGIRLGVASSSAPDFIDTALTHLGLRDLVSVTQSALDLERGKPDGLVYRLTLSRLGERAEDCVAVEDSGVGIQAARNAGLRCVGVYLGDRSAAPEELARCVVETPRLTMQNIEDAFAASQVE